MKMTNTKHILLAKMGLDCHDTGIITVEAMLQEAGYEVTYMGLHNTAEQVVNAAIEKKVDAIGVSFLSGQHLTQMRELMAEIDRRKLVTKVFCGGVIPPDDAETLKKMAVKEVVKPGTLSRDVVAQIDLALQDTSQQNDIPVMRSELTVTALEKCQNAIRHGNKAVALKEAQAIWDEWRPLHDLYVEMSGLFATYIRNKLGEDAVNDAWRFVGDALWKPLLMQMKETGSTKMLVEVYAQFLRAHGHDFTVEVDEEKTTFIMNYCATGGMLMRDGKNEVSSRNPINIAVMDTKADWTYNRKLSAYCVHTPLWMDILPREWGWDVFKSTFGRQFDDDGNPVDEPCMAMIYHEPQS
jgi:methylmalonyl-CoA mutase cobalamin-binding domain/chain